MDSLTKFALDILRDRNFSRLDEEVREEVLSLFIDDQRKPSKEGRRTLWPAGKANGRATTGGAFNGCTYGL